MVVGILKSEYFNSLNGHFVRIAGIDEVGRGSLAGPVIAAAVVFKQDTLLNLPVELKKVNDSKKLSPKLREQLDREIRHWAIGVGIGGATVEEVNSYGVWPATERAMRRAVQSIACDCALVDGDLEPDLGGIPAYTIIGGDHKEFSIAAASIVAKVYRDQLMRILSKEFPEYGFARNKGYGTLEHRAALRRFGYVKGLHRPNTLRKIGATRRKGVTMKNWKRCGDDLEKDRPWSTRGLEALL